ncbi:MAG: T9SS type A sorting domain-containing protein [Bacteroidales bacterium]
MNKNILLQTGTLTILVFLFNHSCVSQVVFSEWIAGTGTKGWDIVNDMTTDRNGNIYLTGSYADTSAKNNTGNTSAKIVRSMYVAKFDTNGKMAWKKNIRNYGSGYGSLIGRGKNNELILAGGTEIPHKTAGIKSGRSGIFISSLTTQGVVNWSQNFTGSKLDYLTSLVVDTLGAEILISGYFHDTLRIGETELITNGKSDGVFLQFGLSGILKNARVIGGYGEDKIDGIAIDNIGNHFVGGTFQQKIQFGKNTKLELNDRKEIGLFLACYNDNGDFILAKQLASGKKIRTHSIIGIDSSILIAGSFSDYMIIGNKTLASLGSDDIFLLCLDKALQIKWYKQIGGLKKDRPSKIISVNKEIILSGSFCSSISINQKKLTTSGIGSDVFVIAFDNSGNLRWMRSTGGEADDYPTSMIPVSKDYIYLAGSFQQKFNLNGKTLQSVGEEDVFIGRLENCHSLAPVFKKPESLCKGGLLHLDAGAGFTSYNWDNGVGRKRTFDIDQAGLHPLELIAVNGCIIYDTIGVLDIPQPYVYLGKDTTIADTSRIILHAGGNFTHCLWNNGTTTSENLIKGVELKEGPNVIMINVIGINGCTSADDMVINMIRTMPNQVSEKVSGSCILFPNPTNDLVTVYFTMSFKSLILTINDLMGRELVNRAVSGYVNNTPLEFNLGTLPKGIYILNMKTERGVATKKIVLQ